MHGHGPGQGAVTQAETQTIGDMQRAGMRGDVEDRMIAGMTKQMQAGAARCQAGDVGIHRTEAEHGEAAGAVWQDGGLVAERAAGAGAGLGRVAGPDFEDSGDQGEGIGAGARQRALFGGIVTEQQTLPEPELIDSGAVARRFAERAARRCYRRRGG